MTDTGAFRVSPIGNKWQITVLGESKLFTHEEALKMVADLMWDRSKDRPKDK